jgi:LCP family protein required for cell wall assembly
MRLPSWLFLVGVLGLVVATAVCGVGTYTFARRTAIDLGSSGVQVASFADFVRAQPTPTLTPVPATAAPSTTPLPGVTPTATLPPTATVPAGPVPTTDPLAGYTWNDPRRVNILLLGMDQRGDEQGPFRTDTLIVVSIDPVRRSIGMLSIPRDLYVPIPGFRQNRINTANYLGDANAYPGGGPALAARTVTDNLGLPVEKYIRVNFDVFTRVVDLVAPNGVEVCPREAIDDPDYPDAGYGIIPVYFAAGCQRLDSTRLLQYARTRATQGSDFDRAARQQEVIKALRDEVLSAGGLARFFTQIPALWDELSGAYETNLTLEEIISLANLVQDIPRERITSGVINNLYVELSVSPEGEQILIPRYNAIRSLISEVFNPVDATLTLDDLRERAAAENAEIVIFNDTTITGLAGQTRDFMAGRGVAISAVGNMPEPTNGTTVIRDYRGRIWTARYLAALLGLSNEAIQPGGDGMTAADVMIVAGTDMPSLIGVSPITPTATP